MSKGISERLQQTRFESGLNWGEYDATHPTVSKLQFFWHKTLVKAKWAILARVASPRWLSC